MALNLLSFSRDIFPLSYFLYAVSCRMKLSDNFLMSVVSFIIIIIAVFVVVRIQ